jgi:hypothetical protein
MFLQATLERLENVFQIQSQDEFVNMTNQTNGTVNGHGKFPQPVQQYSTV